MQMIISRPCVSCVTNIRDHLAASDLIVLIKPGLTALQMCVVEDVFFISSKFINGRAAGSFDLSR